MGLSLSIISIIYYFFSLFLDRFLFSSALDFLEQLFFFLAFINSVKKISSSILSNFALIHLPAFVILFWFSATSLGLGKVTSQHVIFLVPFIIVWAVMFIQKRIT